MNPRIRIIRRVISPFFLLKDVWFVREDDLLQGISFLEKKRNNVYD
jgi:hypothetical protein